MAKQAEGEGPRLDGPPTSPALADGAGIAVRCMQRIELAASRVEHVPVTPKVTARARANCRLMRATFRGWCDG